MVDDPGKIKQIQLQTFPGSEVKQAFFTRHGGVSPAPWASLNQGGLSGDARANVVENRRRIFEHFGRPVESIFDVWQVHSGRVVCSDSPRPLQEPHQKADAILTDRSDVTLMMRFADCVPILFYDPIRRVVGIAHAGWQGTLVKIAGEVVKRMQQTYHCQPGQIMAGIGPSIGPECYEIGADVLEKVAVTFEGRLDEVIFHKGGKNFFNLWQANRLILQDAGVVNIEMMEICTACHTEDWYSHRAEHGSTGRFGALIALV